MSSAVDTIIQLAEARDAADRREWVAVLALAECLAADSVEPARELLRDRTILGQRADRLEPWRLDLFRSIVRGEARRGA